MISFIIPAYNAEDTIELTIRSIINVYEDAEIIVVENGSTDHTTERVQLLVSKFQNVKLIHSEKGVSKARNAGIQYATNKWVSFIDSDDIWLGNKTEIEDLMIKKNKVDLFLFSYKKENQIIQHDYPQIDVVIDSKEELTNASAWMIKRPTLRMTVWAKIFKKDFLQNYKLEFDEELTFSEDSEFMLRCLKKVKSLFIASSIVYQYCNSCNSSTRRIDPSRIDAYLESLKKVLPYFIETNNLMKRAYRDYVIAQINLIAVHNVFSVDIKVPWNERKEMIRKIYDENDIKDYASEFSLSDFLDPYYFSAILFKNGIYGAGGLICYLRSYENKKRP